MAQATDKGLQLRCNVSRKGNTITWTIEVWSASHAWNDAQTLHWSGATNGSANYHASAGYGESRKMYSRTVSITGTPGKTYTLWTSISGAFNGANPTPGGVSATIPVSAPNTPSAPTITRVSDTKHTVAWSRSASSSAPITSQQVQRSEWNGSAWTNWVGVANVNTTYTNNGNHSWTDPGTKANRRYRYRIKAANSSGEKYSTAVGNVYTTPGVPSSVSAVKTSSNGINITVAQTVTFSQHQTVLRYSADGGTTWTALTTLGSGVETYLWASPPLVPSVIVDAAVKVNASGAVGNGLTSATRKSKSVGLTVPPNPPGGLTPNGVVVASGEGPALVSWAYNSADSSEQSAFEVEWNFDPSMDPWIVAVTGTTETSVALPAWLTESPGTLHWRVRTKGAHPNWSAFSASALITISDRPVATVTSPSATHESSRVTIGWEYSDNEETAQSMWEVELLLDGQVIESKSGSGSASSVLMNTSLVDDTEYQVRVRVRDGHGLWSDWDQATFTTDFPVPPKPSIFFEWNKELGQKAISVLNPDGAPLVSHNVVQRSIDEKDTWQDVIEVAYNGVGFDKTVPLGTRVWYRVQAWSDVPSVSYSEEILYEDGYSPYREPVTNLFTNPRLKGDGTWAEVRRNLFPLPRLNGMYPVPAGGEGTATYLPGGGWEVTRTGAGDVFWDNAVIVPNDGRYVFSLEGPEGVLINGGFWNQSRNSTGLTVISNTREDGRQTVILDLVGVTALGFRMFLRSAFTEQNVPYVFDKIIFEQAPEYRPYFDGSTTSATAGDIVQPEDFRWRWLGTQNASESVMEIERVAGFSAHRCVAGVSTRDGKPAMRLIPTGASSLSYAWSAIPVEARSSGTALGTLYLDEPLTGSLNTNALSIRVHTPTQKETATNTAGEHPLRLGFSGITSGNRLRLYHGGAQGAGEVWWTDIGLFAGTYQGDFFDGDTEWVQVDGVWMHTRWNSDGTSTASMPDTAVTMTVERSIDNGVTWQPVLVDETGTVQVSDHEALSNGVTIYRVTTYAATGAATVREYPVPSDSDALWLGGGIGHAETCRLPYSPQVSISGGRERVLKRYSGRSKPVVYAGEATSRTVDTNGMILVDETDNTQPDDLIRVAQNEEPTHLYRDPDGRHVTGMLTDAQVARQSHAHWSYSFQLEESEA